MVTHEDLARFLLTQDPQNQPAILAFYNYLKNLENLDDPFTPQTLSHFFGRALSVPHWQKNREELSQSIEAALSTFSEEVAIPWKLQDLRLPRNVQVVAIENLEDLVEILTQDFRNYGNRDSRWKAVPYRDRGVLSIEQRPDNSIQMIQYPRWIQFCDGRPVPLFANRLEYNEHLELLPHRIQHVEISPYQVARFFIDDQGLHGVAARGFTFSKSEQFEARSINDLPRLFYAVKQLESFFVNRATDPLYREIVELLERAAQLAADPNEEGRELALKAFERGQNALEHIFPDDKVIFLLLRDLARSLERVSPREESWESPKPEFV